MNATIPCFEERTPVSPIQPRALITPLARAALDNGVSFADVQAYCEGRGVDDPESLAAWYEAVNVPAQDETTPALSALVTSMITDTILDAALARSVLAEGTIEHARLWWLGVLP